MSERVSDDIDDSKPFELLVDTTTIATGSCVAQRRDDEVLMPVAFASKLLSDAQRRYEASRIWYALKHCHHHLLRGAPAGTIISTDHRNIVINADPRATTDRRSGRWLADINEYVVLFGQLCTWIKARRTRWT